MIKKTIFFLAVLLFFLSSTTVLAQTLEINSLLGLFSSSKIISSEKTAQAMAYSTDLKKMGTYTNINGSFSIPIFKNNLTLNSTGAEVILLKKILNSSTTTKEINFVNGQYTTGQANIFDAYTKGAVIRFQEKYANEILTPNGLSKGTGFVGVSTRSKLNQLSLDAPTLVEIFINDKIISLEKAAQARFFAENLRKQGISLSLFTTTLTTIPSINSSPSVNSLSRQNNSSQVSNDSTNNQSNSDLSRYRANPTNYVATSTTASNINDLTTLTNRLISRDTFVTGSSQNTPFTNTVTSNTPISSSTNNYSGGGGGGGGSSSGGGSSGGSGGSGSGGSIGVAGGVGGAVLAAALYFGGNVIESRNCNEGYGRFWVTIMNLSSDGSVVDMIPTSLILEPQLAGSLLAPVGVYVLGFRIPVPASCFVGEQEMIATGGQGYLWMPSIGY
ncbi:MAG: hypothetical protein WAV11_03035 [Minisyncoccia bacterium]